MSEWMFGDEGRILIAPTEADKKKVLEMAEAIPDADLLKNCGIIVGEMLVEAILASGKRPADYWRGKELPEKLAARIQNALKSDPTAFVSVVQATLKGGG